MQAHEITQSARGRKAKTIRIAYLSLILPMALAVAGGATYGRQPKEAAPAARQTVSAKVSAKPADDSVVRAEVVAVEREALVIRDEAGSSAGSPWRPRP